MRCKEGNTIWLDFGIFADENSSKEISVDDVLQFRVRSTLE